MTRIAHKLEQTVGMGRPRRIVFFDTETKWKVGKDGRTVHTLRLGVAKFYELSREGSLSLRQRLTFTDPNEFVLWLDAICKKKSTTYIIAHNLVFDLSVCGLFYQLNLLGWKLDNFYSKGMVSIFHWKDGERRLKGLDNGNFFRGTLDSWGKVLGYDKLPIRFNQSTDSELTAYCERDVDIMVRLWQTWLAFLDSHDCGSFKPTVSSTAFNTWRHRFMTETVHIHIHEEAIRLERESYRGGRTECLWVGSRSDGPFYYLDVNNMYGYILATKPFPAGLYNYSDHVSLYGLAYKLERHAVIADVTIDIDEPWFPYKIDGRTCYPVGRFRTTLTTPELKLCIDRGWMVEAHSIAWYREEKLFTDYVETFNVLRHDYERQGDKGFAKICKLLVNGLYGKFGQRSLKIERIGECDPSIVKRERVYDEVRDTIFDQVYLAGFIYRELKEGESFHSFPGIASHVTAYARLHLFGLTRDVEKSHVYYMDTDSLVVDQLGYEALKDKIIPGKLGALKIEQQSPWLKIHAPKDYSMEGRFKLKGISPSAEKLSEGVYRQTHWLKLAGLIREGITEGYITKEVVKHQLRVIHSGVVQPGGWVQPFHLPLPQPAPVALPQLQDVER